MAEDTIVVPEIIEDMPPDAVVFGRSETMRHLQQTLSRVVATHVPVLLHGESGTGKEIIAKLLHRRSPWKDGPFVKINCPAIPGTLLEAELFGYEKGAFTGAYALKRGRVEAAYRGTLFLDEISELEIGLQAKLLQVLQDGTFCRIGAQKERRVEVRVVCATNRNLKSEVEGGNFRQDLFFRITGLSLRLPALRERAEDIPDITNYLLDYYAHKFNLQVARPSLPFMKKLQQYSWPGNIRELENLIRRYVIMGGEEDILGDMGQGFPTPLYLELPADGTISLRDLTQQTVRQVEGAVIRKVLAMNNWNRKRTAETLDMSYRALLYKIRELGIPSSRRSKPEDERRVAVHAGGAAD